VRETLPSKSGEDPGIRLRGAIAGAVNNGCLGAASALAGSRGRASGQVVKGTSPPPETERHSLFRCPKEGEIWPIVKDLLVALKMVQFSKCFFRIGTQTSKMFYNKHCRVR